MVLIWLMDTLGSTFLLTQKLSLLLFVLASPMEGQIGLVYFTLWQTKFRPESQLTKNQTINYLTHIPNQKIATFVSSP
jgi:hypothetical protein